MDKKRIRNIFIGISVFYIIFVVAFYFIAGEQIKYKESNKVINMPDANSITDEITEDVVIEQTFINELDKMEEISLVFTANWRKNSGIVKIELLDGEKVLHCEEIFAKDIPEQHRIYIYPKDIREDIESKELTLKITSNSKEGDAVSAMMNSQSGNGMLLVNGEVVPGSICFATKGQENLVAAQVYWYVMSTIGLIMAAVLFVSYNQYSKKGKANYIVMAILALFRYEFLISQLVARDFKSKYKRSVFGIFWSFLNPLLTMLVQFFVFSTFFAADTKNYPVYLIVGVVCFSFFNECTSMCLQSITGNFRLITKVYIPKYIFPLARTISSSINLGISLIPLLLVALITGTPIHKSILLFPFFLVCLVMFSLGVGMILSAMMVFFRDIQFIWSVLTTIWMYATPIFYPAEIIPEKYRFIVQFNPLYHFIGNARKCLISGISPEPMSYIYCLIFAFGALLIGSYVFKKCQDKFTLYL